MRSPSRSIIPSLDLRRSRTALQALVAGAFLLAAVMLGGASGSGIGANAVLQVAAVVAIAVCLGWSPRPERALAERSLLVLAGLWIAWYALQSVPLPPAVWTALPGRQPIAAGLSALGGPLPWLPLSLAPGRTLASGLALLPPLAMIMMIGAFRRPVAGATVVALLAAMVASVLLGVAQVAGSERLYFYVNTNIGSAVGFFANANHFGTLMCVTMPLAAGLIARWRGDPDGRQAASRVMAAAALLAIVLLALLGVIMTKSIAAVLLAVLAVVGSAAIVLSGFSGRVRLGFVAGVVLVVIVVAAVALSNGTSDLGSAALAGSELGRRQIWHATANAIGQFGLLGSGFGSFPQLFHLFENPDALDVVVINHAHNDLLELLLEGGIPALVLLVAFLVWVGARFVSLWLRDRRRDPLAQGASVAVLIVLLHSLVDYPLRTAAMATLFGFCLALVARGQAGDASKDDAADAPAGRHLSA